MRIQGPNGAAPVSAGTSPARRAASERFTLGEPEPTRTTGGPSATRDIGGIDALLALQGVEDPTERRKRAVSRGRGALDLLDELKMGLLSGALDRVTLARLKTAAAGLKSSSGEAGLDQVLAEIDLRVEVELAKFDHP